MRATVVLAGSACSTSYDPVPCTVDKDCPAAYVCELHGEQPICVASADAPLVVGQSAPFSGSNQWLGVGMRQGIQLAFSEQNARGGVRGRELKLVTRDDSYDPMQAELNARALVDVVPSTQAPKCPNTSTPVSNGAVPPVLTAVSTTALARGPNAVLAMIGNVGTPTAVRAAPVTIETGTLFFGAFTGAAALLRDETAGPCAKYIFNVRASYAQEALATWEYFSYKGVADYKALISFDQNDAFGNAGYTGLVAAYAAKKGFPIGVDPATAIARFRYIRNDDASVPVQAQNAEMYLTQLLTDRPGTLHVGIMMTDTYGAAISFIAHVRAWQFDGLSPGLGKDSRLILHFSNVSFVGPNALADGLVARGTVATPGGAMSLTQDVMVSQVVPNYESDLGDVVQQYIGSMRDAGQSKGFTSLEGYITGRVFVAGLLDHEGPFTPVSLIKTFESLPDLGLGIGANVGYSDKVHQYSNSVWGTSLRPDGSFKNLYFWTSTSPIQFFE